MAVRISVINGDTAALNQLLKVLGVPVAEFKLYGQNSPEQCDRTVHAPHQIGTGTYCMGRSGCEGKQVLFIVVSERILYPGSAKGISFLLPGDAFPHLKSPLTKASAGQGPGYTG